MAEPSDILGEVARASELARETETAEKLPASAEETKQKARRAEALALRMAGFSDDTIAERMGITATGVRQMIDRTLSRATNQGVELGRELENARLDRAQAAIWNEVIAGDKKAITVFLKISAERSKINGLYAPTKVDLQVSVREEMQRALNELEAAAEELVLEAVVIEDDDDEEDLTDDDARVAWAASEAD